MCCWACFQDMVVAAMLSPAPGIYWGVGNTSGCEGQATELEAAGADTDSGGSGRGSETGAGKAAFAADAAAELVGSALLLLGAGGGGDAGGGGGLAGKGGASSSAACMNRAHLENSSTTKVLIGWLTRGAPPPLPATTQLLQVL